jgi:ATP-dependent exoDNAse (exonuclease V) beta subunit
MIKPNYLRVTEVLSRYSGLDQVDPEILKRAAERGTAVHDYIEEHTKGTCWMPPSDLVAPYFKSFEAWFDYAVEDIFIVEHRFYDDELGVTGACDLICRLRGDDGLTIIDYKTPTSLSSSYALQTAAYYRMARAEFGDQIKRRACVQLFKDGSPAFFKEYTDHERDQYLFVAAVNLHKFFK